MAGLRAKQKADRNRRILQSATDLFRSGGYDSTRIEDIAESAEVSVGTLYNYYQNKGDVLLAAVSMEVEEVLQSGDLIISRAHEDVLSALKALIGQYFDHSLVYLSKEMWRIAMALSIQQPQSPFSVRYTELDRRLCTQVVELIRTLQARDKVRSDIDVTSAGEMIFNNLNMMFIEFAKDEEMTVEDLKNSVQRQNGPIAQLISKTESK